MRNQLNLFSLLAVAGALTCLTGCSKREEPAPVAAPSAEVEPADAQPQAGVPETHAIGPSPADLAAQQAAMERLRQAEMAARQREYEQAVEALLAIREQQRILSEQQAQLYYQQMQKLQSDLAAAIAAGDPRAKAAAERLRRAATVR